MTKDEAWAVAARMERMALTRRRPVAVWHIDVPKAVVDAIAHPIYPDAPGLTFCGVPVRIDANLPDDALRLVEGVR